MSESSKTAWQRLPVLFRMLLFLVVIVLISMMFPNTLKFKYEYERQQTWRYEDLQAPFDFPIRKTDEELEAERELVLETLTPVYQLDREIARQRKEAFATAFQSQLAIAEESGQFRDVPRRPDTYLNYGQGLLDRIFQRGIILLAPEHREKERDFVITIIRGNTAQEQTLENILKVETARSILSDSLPYARLAEPEFLYPLMEEQLQANLFYSDTLTERLKRETLNQIVTSQGLVRKGDLIIAEGGIVTDDIYQTLKSFQEQYELQVSSKKSRLGVYLGYLLLTALVVIVFGFYLRYFAKEVYHRFPKLLFIMMWLVIYGYLVFLVEGATGLNTYLIPFCIVPIVIKTFYNAQLALFTHIVVVLIASFLSALGYEFTFLQIFVGIVVMLTDIDTRNWSRFFYSMLFIFLGYALGFLGLSLIKQGSLMDVDWSVYSWIFLNVVLTLLAYPLIPLLERFFGFVSPITLTELSDMNRPLLRELAMKAPGTLQHSLQVGNLSEAAARRIGADPLLVRVAALYHDVGKTKHPEYFIENQSGRNPHEDKTELESARIIIDHVQDGVQMARKAGLPTLLIDFILTHHGTTRTEYFYRTYLKDHPHEEVDESLFRYPGPRPRSKEETILMMADSIEAACKSLKDPTQDELFGLIEKIIQGKVASGQFENSRMSFRELEECKKVFQSIMKSVHHVRIEYPEEEE